MLYNVTAATGGAIVRDTTLNKASCLTQKTSAIYIIQFYILLTG